ncbi:DUF1444 domain-containing protein [Abyssicoccus albus]|uniref:DUF1444 domain-containing protein n=1 Tax=Abyssicoccus albus TaxID=1817405 RepID=UPI00097E3785|nr:DUF1444 domain-containing protein [Abyssicoccus albus]AQL56507.1 DUF1444 domain-containing protein [Abyssicoccus albus]
MNVFEMRDLIKEQLDLSKVNTSFNREDDTLRIERKDNEKGLSIKIGQVINKYNENGEQAVEEIVYYINSTIEAHGLDESQFNGDDIYPVIRATSFHQETTSGSRFITTPHTAETMIYYAIDLENTYRLIDESLIKKLNMTEEEVKERALFNIKRKPTPMNQDEVNGNIYYFINSKDGYDASRILNKPFLDEMRSKIEGEMMIATPHQDTLIIADIKNSTGYDVLAQMTMHFFTNGIVPITSLSFSYKDDGSLEPVFILGKQGKSRHKKE